MKYAMIKIRNPKCIPVSMVCQYADEVPMAAPQQNTQKNQSVQRNSDAGVIKPILKSKCLLHPAQQQLQHSTLEIIKLEWKFKNVGDSVWPQNVKLIQVNGDKLVQEIEI